MIEQTYDYATADDRKIEILVERDGAQINHAVMPPGEGLPEHFSNSDVSLVIIRGIMSAQLGDQEAHIYAKGKILDIPHNIRMNIRNGGSDILEFFIVKAPHPRNYGK
ncbi:MAG: cupin domain-containing protein [Acidobacteria bacterium]|nr:cupin domain-containing protein [Acidobacteriota bacterium]